jgi:hypothetical protein
VRAEQKQELSTRTLIKNLRLRSIGWRIFPAILALLFFSGCTTAWQTQGSIYRPTQTQLRVESNPQGKVSINNKEIGMTPLETPLAYSQEIEKKTRKVSYWSINPGGALFMSLVSFGILFPLSLIPEDIETSLEPQESYQDNVFTVEVDTEGYKRWRQEVVGKGEKTVVLQPVLEKEAGR